MKKFKNNKVGISFILGFLFLLQACQRDIVIPKIPDNNFNIKSINNHLPEVENYKLVTMEDAQVKNLLYSPEIIQSGINFTHAVFYKVKFKGFSSLNGIHIVLESRDSTSRDLFYVEDSETKTDLSVIREKIGFQQKRVGRVIFKEPNGREFANDYFENDKIIANSIMSLENSRGSFILQNNKNIKSNAVWKCSSAQFNTYYQEAKNACESDWLCDFACTFNPCAISYVAYAVGKCSGTIK